MDDAAMRWGYVTASPHRPSHRLIVHRIASSCITSPDYLKRQCEPSRPSYLIHYPRLWRLEFSRLICEVHIIVGPSSGSVRSE